MSRIYSIRSGDTLGRLASFHGISLGKLLAMNPQIENPDLIFPGQAILVPDSAASPAPVLAEQDDATEAPIWMKIAAREDGVEEIPGPQHELRVLEYLAVCTKTDPDLRTRDETAWCSAFACWVMEQAGFESPRTAWARTWFDAKWGQEEPMDEPRVGAVAVLSRDQGGHVGFLMEDRGDEILMRGGNQSNKVKAQLYPKNGVKWGQTYKLLGYRWPDGA